MKMFFRVTPADARSDGIEDAVGAYATERCNVFSIRIGKIMC